MVAAVRNDGTQRPWSFSEIALMDLIDITIAANNGKKGRAKRYPRPWEGAKKIGKGSIPLDIAINIFGALGHSNSVES